MNNKLKVGLILLITIGVIAGGILLYLHIKPNNKNTCQKINDKYKLTGDNKYVLQDKSIQISDLNLCCPVSCQGLCDINSNPGSPTDPKCEYEGKKDEYNNAETTFPEYDCEKDFIVGDKKEGLGTLCYINPT